MHMSMPALALLALLPARGAAALDLRAGPIWIEQGDYLLHPGVQVGVGTKTPWSFRLDFSGRRFGPFTEATGILSGSYELGLLPWSEVSTTAGVSILDEYTAYKPHEGSVESIHAMNFGGHLGLAYTVLDWKGLKARVEWNAHLFAAGLAFVYLTTARKSVIGFSVGYEL